MRSMIARLDFKKRLICSLSMFVGSLIATLLFAQDHVDFWIRCSITSAIVGFLILPHFIKNHSEMSDYGSASAGGAITTLVAILASMAAVIWPYGSLIENLPVFVFGSLYGIAFVGLWAFPIGIVGAISVQAIWRRQSS